MDGWYKVILVTKEGFIFHDDEKALAFAKAMHSLMYYADEIKPVFADPEGVQFLVKGNWQAWLTRLEVDGVLEHLHVKVTREE